MFSLSKRAIQTQAKSAHQRWPSVLPLEFVDYMNQRHNLQIANEDIKGYAEVCGGLSVHWERVNQLNDEYRSQIFPESQEKRGKYQTFQNYDQKQNQFGEWATKFNLQTTTSGPLSGKTFGIKDSVMVAGFPARNGSNLLDNYICQSDATVVTRILAAGGTIVGKTQCEYLCYSGGSHTSYPNAVHNPHNPLYSAGGSSSGSGAAVASGSCDMAIGGDQGGSVRLPGCWSGTVGHKGTYGLVPYTGAFSLEPHFDHLGPMARTVSDCAALLKAIAGRDGFDLRQMYAPAHSDAQFLADMDSALQEQSCDSITIGVVKEGFANGCEAEVADKVRRAIDLLGANANATVVDVSIPMHADAAAIWCAIGVPSQTLTYLQFGGIPPMPRGRYDDQCSIAMRDCVESGALAKGSATHIMNHIAGEWMLKNYGSHYYAAGQNLAHVLKQKIESAMDSQNIDVLIYPTINKLPDLLPTPTKEESLGDQIGLALSMIGNTVPSSVTGHPTLQIPVEYSDELQLPIGMSIVAKDWMDHKCFHVANCYERLRGPLKTFPTA